MKKSFLASLTVHALIMGILIGLIHTPYEVETITIPLDMPIAFETNALNSPSDKSVPTPPAPTKHVDTIAPVTTPKIVRTEPKNELKAAEEITTTAHSTIPLAEEHTVIQSSAPVTSVHETLAEAIPTPTPAAAHPIDPNLKANFDLIRKRTYERLYYPQDAQNALKEGTATLIYKLSSSGVVESIVLEHSTGYADLDEIVLKAAQSLQGEQLRAVDKRINIRLSIEFAVTNKAV